MAIASKRLGLLAAALAGYHSIYTVPAGYRTIVKSIWMRNNTAGAFTGAWGFIPSGGSQVTFFQPLTASPAAGSTVKLEPWLVLNAGDQLVVAGVAGSGVDAAASGAELAI